MTGTAPTHPTPRFDIRWLMEVLTLAALYFLTARLGLLVAIPGGHVTPVWPPSGIALAAVLLRGRRVWPGIWLGSFVANILDFYGSPMSLATELTTSATFGIGASLTALLGSQLLRWFVNKRNPLERVRDVCAFMALGGVVSCLVSATVGVTMLCLTSFAPWLGYREAWLTWWLGDTAGVFIVAPLFLVWGGTHRRMSAARWVELFGGFGLLIAVTYFVFIENTTVPFTGKPLTFALVPFLVWAAVRFERRGAVTASGLIALLAVWGTIQGSGPFNLGSRDESLVDLELFLGVVSLTALCIAAVVTARRDAESDRRRVLAELESRVAERTASLDQANTALREVHDRLSTIIQKAPLAIIAIDSAAIVQIWNPAAEHLFGWTAAEIAGRPVLPLIPKEERRQFEELFAGEIKGEVRDGLELRRLRKDGSLVDVSVWTAPLRNAQNEIAGTIGMFADITQRKTIEKALETAEEQYRSIFNNVVDGIFRTSPDGKFLVANPAAARIFGFASPEELIEERRDIAQQGYVDPRRREEFKRLLLEQGVVTGFEYEAYRKDGSRVWISENTRAVHSPSGEILYFEGIFEDVTDRKRAEQALRESEERFRELAENIHEVFWVWTATPGKARCLYVSPAYATIWGRSCESLYSSPQSWMEALHPQDNEWVREEGARMDFEKITDWTYRIVRPDQSIRWIRDRIFPVRDLRGAVVRFAGIAQDITESKEAEQTVRKANRQLRILSRRRIQEQEDERRRLSRELHDQIGQSLTAAKINVEALRSTKNPTLVRRIDETAAILDQLLGQVRQISLDLRPPMLDDLGLVPALRSFIDEQGRRASVAVRFSAENIPENLDPEIQTTCFRIAQEAITNAARHAKAAQIDIALRCKNRKTLQLLVRDNGIGFNARAVQAQTDDLGLIGMKERAALVGGRARIMSLPGKGTTISVSLPLTFQPERQTRHMGK